MGGAEWGMLCYDASISILVGEVTCRQTEHMFLSRISRGDHPSGFSGRAFYNGTINCTGDEEKLSQCSVNLAPVGWCPGKYTVIDCMNGEKLNQSVSHLLCISPFAI